MIARYETEFDTALGSDKIAILPIHKWLQRISKLSQKASVLRVWPQEFHAKPPRAFELEIENKMVNKEE